MGICVVSFSSRAGGNCSQIGKLMLAKFRSEGLFNVVVEDETDDDPGNGE